MGQSIISLSLQNATPLPQPVSVFNPLPQQSSSGSGNATQSSYSYDISGELNAAITNGFTYLSITYSINGGLYKTLNINNGSVISSVQDFISILNSLGQSLFYKINNTTIGCFSISPNGNNYYYSSISTNANYTVNSFVGDNNYGKYGTLIYNKGYNSQNGVGVLTRINPSNTFWINSIPDTTSGNLNRSGVWSSNIPYDNVVDVGFQYAAINANISVNVAKYVYIGIASGVDNNGGLNSNILKLYVNNVLTISMIESEMIPSINAQTGLTVTNPSSTCWNIYPILLNSGNNLITVYGLCPVLTQFPDPQVLGAIAFEVYDNTSAQIDSATSYAQLNVLFSTANYTGLMI